MGDNNSKVRHISFYWWQGVHWTQIGMNLTHVGRSEFDRTNASFVVQYSAVDVISFCI